MAKKFDEDKEISEIFSTLAKDELVHRKQFNQLPIFRYRPLRNLTGYSRPNSFTNRNRVHPDTGLAQARDLMRVRALPRRSSR